MKINLKTKFQALIDQYKSDMADYQERYRTELQHFNDDSVKRRFSDLGLQEAVGEKRSELLADLDAICTTFNQKAAAILDESKETVISAAMGKPNRPADHATQVSNALNFLDRETADTLTDDVAFDILKLFTMDYDQMKLFQRVVEAKVGPIIDDAGNVSFPKTFGPFAKVDSIIQAFSEMEPIINGIFINAKYDGADGVTVVGVYYALPMDGYIEVANWDTLISLAGKVDQYVESELK